MYLVSYREIFDALKTYFDPQTSFPSLKEIAQQVRDKYDAAFEEAEKRFVTVIWDEETQLDPRPVEDFKRDMHMANNQKMFYVLEGGMLTNVWTTNPYTNAPLLSDDDCNEAMEKYVNEKIKVYMINRLVSEILDELVDKELDKEEKTENR
jgi:hypothetical protein